MTISASDQCITCKHFTLRLSSSMAKAGYGNCSFEKPWTFESATFPRVCAKHDPTETHLVEGRENWLNNQRNKSHDFS